MQSGHDVDRALQAGRDEVLNDGQSEAGAALVPSGRVERLEHPRDLFGRYSVSEIAHAQHKPCFAGSRGFGETNLNRPATAARIGIPLRVGQKIEQDLRQDAAIADPGCALLQSVRHTDVQAGVARVDREQTDDVLSERDE